MEISIRDILAKHPTPGIREANIRHAIAEAVEICTGVAIEPSQVKHQEGRVSLSVPPVLKSALLLRIEEFKTFLTKEGVEVTDLH